MANERRQIVYRPDMPKVHSWIATRQPNLTAEQAAEDVAVFFEALRHLYAGHHYFGGDQVFVPMRDELLAMAGGQEHLSDTRPFEPLRDRFSAVIADYYIRPGSYS